MSGLRFAFYGRLSTDDRQDVTLARPSQLEACQRKAAELGGEIVVEFFDQEIRRARRPPRLDRADPGGPRPRRAAGSTRS